MANPFSGRELNKHLNPHPYPDGDPNDKIETHPVQTRQPIHKGARAPVIVTLRAYEVYVALFGEQKAMVTGGCRGGFGAGELIGLLYAHTFPKAEWQHRFEEALRGMEQL